MSHSGILFTLCFHSLAPLLACSSYLTCSLDRIPHSYNIYLQSCASIFSLTSSYIHPPLIWFTFWGALVQHSYWLQQGQQPSPLSVKAPIQTHCVQSAHRAHLLLCLLENKWWIHFQCFQMPQRQLQTSQAFSGQSINVIFVYIQILIFPKCGSTRAHSSKILNSTTQLNIVVLTTLWPQTFFFSQFVYLLSPLSSYIVPALQKEYEIFIRASCVEGTTSTW